MMVPENLVSMKISSGIKPEAKPVLSSPYAICECVCWYVDMFSFIIAQEFNVHLMMIMPLRR